METFKVVETFVSINGEGKKAGRLAMFIRLKGCNLNCSYCDTTWANKRDARCELLTAPQIVERIKEAGVELVTLTGGEPLLDENVSELIGSILMMPKVEIEIETNGSVPIRYYKERDNRLTMTMDYKLSCVIRHAWNVVPLTYDGARPAGCDSSLFGRLLELPCTIGSLKRRNHVTQVHPVIWKRICALKIWNI